jgi:hypothetical protein
VLSRSSCEPGDACNTGRCTTRFNVRAEPRQRSTMCHHAVAELQHTPVAEGSASTLERCERVCVINRCTRSKRNHSCSCLASLVCSELAVALLAGCRVRSGTDAPSLRLSRVATSRAVRHQAAALVLLWPSLVRLPTGCTLHSASPHPCQSPSLLCLWVES